MWGSGLLNLRNPGTANLRCYRYAPQRTGRYALSPRMLEGAMRAAQPPESAGKPQIFLLAVEVEYVNGTPHIPEGSLN